MMDNQLPNTEEIVVGLDIGTTKIACFIGQKNEFGKIELLGYGRSESVGVSRGVVANIDRTVASIQQAVQETEQKVGPKSDWSMSASQVSTSKVSSTAASSLERIWRQRSTNRTSRH